MQVPLELAFHHIDATDWAENEIRGRVAKLEKIYDRLVSCRVKVERPNQIHGVPPVVRIELGVPGKGDLVVAVHPEHLQRRFQTPDLRNAINEAFRIAERQLLELKEQRNRRTKQAHHDDANQFLGQVAEMNADEDHGFLLTKEGSLLYFHRNGLLTGDFDKLSRGDQVHYVEEIGDTGPIATKVRIKA